MKEKPIIFSSEMVKAILDGRKTQTRRVITPQPIGAGPLQGMPVWKIDGVLRFGIKSCPYGRPGDHLWVRETFAPCGDTGAVWLRAGIPEYRAGRMTGKWIDFPYKVDKEIEPPDDLKWTPSIFMPRWASRITLEVTAVRVKLVQDISEEDAKAEGVQAYIKTKPAFLQAKGILSDEYHKAHFKDLWESINGNRKDKNGKRLPYAWADNPWVWVVEFKLNSS